MRPHLQASSTIEKIVDPALKGQYNVEVESGRAGHPERGAPRSAPPQDEIHRPGASRVLQMEKASSSTDPGAHQPTYPGFYVDLLPDSRTGRSDSDVLLTIQLPPQVFCCSRFRVDISGGVLFPNWKVVALQERVHPILTPDCPFPDPICQMN